MTKSFFDTMQRSFKDVTISEDGVNTLEFLEASESLIAIFNLMSSAAFVPVKADMEKNVQKTRKRYNAFPSESQTLELLTINETSTEHKEATEGLLWLLRGLEFTLRALQNSVNNPSQELTESFQLAYKNTLKKYHNAFVGVVFNLAMKACPTRADFYEKLGSDQEKVKEELVQWLNSLEVVVNRMKSFYLEKHAKRFKL